MSYEGERPFFAPRPSNGSAIAALGFSVLALLLAVTPTTWLATTACGLLALVAGTVGLGQARRDPRLGGTAMSVVGLVVGSLVFLGLILILLFYEPPSQSEEIREILRQAR